MCQNVALCGNGLTLYHTILTFNDTNKGEAFENILGKGENAGKPAFSPFPLCFLPFPKKTNFNFSVTFILLSARLRTFNLID